MKKIVAAIAAVCMGATLLFPLAACGDEGGGNVYSIPTGGTGFGEYDVDRTVENGEKTNSINGQNFDPYTVTEGRYAVTLESVESKVYFAFSAGKIGVFSVASEGDADPCVTQLIGNPIGGIRNLGGDYFSGDISESNKNFKYEFKCDQSDLDGAGGVLYFEIGISDPASAGIAFSLVFQYEREYVDDKPKIETTVITPTEEFRTFEAPAGKKLVKFADTAFDLSIVPVLGADGYYHANTGEGDVLVALIRTPTFGMDDSFGGLIDRELGMNFVLSDSATHRKDYISFISAYCEHANADGVYPVTQEMADFLLLYLNANVGETRLQEQLMKQIPDDYPWIAACGYYA